MSDSQALRSDQICGKKHQHAFPVRETRAAEELRPEGLYLYVFFCIWPLGPDHLDCFLALHGVLFGFVGLVLLSFADPYRMGRMGGAAYAAP
jgi:hypothetical protein